MRGSIRTVVTAMLTWVLAVVAYAPQVARGLDEESVPLEVEAAVPENEEAPVESGIEKEASAAVAMWSDEVGDVSTSGTDVVPTAEESSATETIIDATEANKPSTADETIDSTDEDELSLVDKTDVAPTADEPSETDPAISDHASDDEQSEQIAEAPEPTEGESVAASAQVEQNTATVDEGAIEERNKEPKQADNEAILEAQSTVKEADAFALKHAGTIADGTYAITNSLGTGFALDVKNASLDNGARVITWKCKTAYNQRWVIKNVGNGYVTIRSVNSDKYLQGGYNDKAFYVVQNARSTSERGQLWIVCKEAGFYKFVSAADLNRVLVVSGGTGAKTGNTCYSYLEAQSVAANRRWRISVTADIQDAQAAAHKNDLANGIYYVTNSANSALILTVKGYSYDNSATAILYKNIAKTGQGWKVTHDSKGYVTFVNVRSGKALDVRGAKAARGTSIIQWTRNSNARNQKWIVAKNPNGSFTIASALTGEQFVLGVSNAKSAAATALATIDTSATQQWKLTKAPAHFANLGDVADGTFLIRTSLNTSKVLDVPNSSKQSGVRVKLWSVSNGANQLWTISHDIYGYVHLKSKSSGLQLAYENGKLVQSSKAYNWVIVKNSNGCFRIRSGSTGKYLDVKKSNTNNSTNEVILFASGTGKNQQWNITQPIANINKNARIMGTSQVMQEQAVRYIKANYSKYGRSLPKKWCNDGETIESIVKYFWEEAAAEGVRADIAIAQSFQETGIFQFGGNAKPEQYNFAGLGVTGSGVSGNSFANARIGVRAQIQHLKAYASTKALNKACVDKRFDYVDRGCAPTIAGLVGTWAMDPSYATHIVDFVNAMLKC